MLDKRPTARRFHLVVMALLGLGVGLACAAPASAEDAAAPPVVTDDIRIAIEKHIAAEVARGDGSFKVIHDGDTLGLRLVRVHVEYLATLGPREHFACVDMASEDGQFYDVDFFMKGDPGAMLVTDTMVHKLNGRPYYLWEQDGDGLWVRANVADADRALLGVLTGEDAFTFRYQATLPEMGADARCWIPLASSDAFQAVTVKSVRAPRAPRTLTDGAHGNQVLFLELTPADSGEPVEIVYEVVRREKGAYADDAAPVDRYLQPEAMVPADPTIKALAEATVAGRQGDLARARALYDHVMDQMRYMKFGEGWGRGDAVRACDSRYGNCTDYHAYFIGLARAVGIPARFAIGASIPSERDNGGTDGYHCWAEFHAEGKWWPVDISEADKYSSLSSYFFGHHPANRIEFSRGRDLVLDPGPAAGPINFLAYPVLEVGGAVRPVKTLFLFERRS